MQATNKSCTTSLRTTPYICFYCQFSEAHILILKTTLKNNQKIYSFFLKVKKKKSSETSLDLPKFKLLVPSFFSLFIDFLNKYTEYSVCDESLRVN